MSLRNQSLTVLNSHLGQDLYVRQYSKTGLKRPLKKKTKYWFSRPITFNAGQKYCRMLQGEHSAILSNFIKLPFVIIIFVFSIFEWPLKTGLTVLPFYRYYLCFHSTFTDCTPSLSCSCDTGSCTISSRFRY